MNWFKQLIAIVLSFLVIESPYAQPRLLLGDSLLKALKTQKNDTEKVKLLIELSNYYTKHSPDTGIIFGAKAVQLASKLKCNLELADANYFIGFNYYNKSNYPAALEYLLNALRIDESISNTKGIAEVTRKIGNVYRDQKNYVKALECYFKSLNIFENNMDTFGIARCYSNIGEIYGWQNRNTDALEFDRKALTMQEYLGYKNGMVITYYRIGRVYQNKKDYYNGLDYNLKGLAIAQKYYDKNEIAKEELQEALGCVGESYLNIVKYTANNAVKHTRIDTLKKSIFYLKQAMSIAREMGELTDLENYCKQISEAEALLGNFENAYQNLWQSYQLQDSIFSAKNNLMITNLETERNKELKDKIDKLETLKKRNEIAVILAAFCFLLIIIVIIFRNNKLIFKEKKKSDDLLVQQTILNNTITKLVDEQEETIKQRTKQLAHANKKLVELIQYNAHNLREPLTRISGAMNIQEYVSKEEFFKDIWPQMQKAVNDLDNSIKDVIHIADETVGLYG